MIENVFGITYSGVEYRVTVKQFQFMVKYILEEIFNLKEKCIDVKINSINNETIFDICSENKNEIATILTGEEFNSRTGHKIKSVILNTIFNSSNISEEVIYKPGFHYKAKEIKFIVQNQHFKENLHNDVIKDDVLNKTIMQIKALNLKKESIIEKHKKTL